MLECVSLPLNVSVYRPIENVFRKHFPQLLSTLYNFQVVCTILFDIEYVPHDMSQWLKTVTDFICYNWIHSWYSSVQRKTAFDESTDFLVEI